jgi:hypothetical protein
VSKSKLCRSAMPRLSALFRLTLGWPAARSLSVPNMGVGVRFFVVRPDDTFERWSQARFNRVWDGDEPVSAFAGRRLRYALVFVDTQARRALGVQAVQWGVLRMDASGRHDPEAALSDAARVMGSASSPYPSPIVDARRKFYERRTRWKPTSRLRAAILDAALKTGLR